MHLGGLLNLKSTVDSVETSNSELGKVRAVVNHSVLNGLLTSNAVLDTGGGVKVLGGVALLVAERLKIDRKNKWIDDVRVERKKKSIGIEDGWFRNVLAESKANLTGLSSTLQSNDTNSLLVSKTRELVRVLVHEVVLLSGEDSVVALDNERVVTTDKRPDKIC